MLFDWVKVGWIGAQARSARHSARAEASDFSCHCSSIRTGRLNCAEIAIVISNLAEAPGLAKAKELGLATAVFVSKGRKREEHDADVAACLKAHHVDLVCLAGYMRLLSPAVCGRVPASHPQHPSLAVAGLSGTRRAGAGVQLRSAGNGLHVHFVDEELDHRGGGLVQRAIPVLETDDAHSLANRILAEEHIAYTEAIARVVSGQYEMRARRYVKKAGSKE